MATGVISLSNPALVPTAPILSHVKAAFHQESASGGWKKHVVLESGKFLMLQLM